MSEQKKKIQGGDFERAFEGSLSHADVMRASCAVVDAALWTDWSLENEVTREGFEGHLRVTPERRSHLVQSIAAHPERTKRLFRTASSYGRK